MTGGEAIRHNSVTNTDIYPHSGTKQGTKAFPAPIAIAAFVGGGYNPGPRAPLNSVLLTRFVC
jgi:hypothetical protein